MAHKGRLTVLVSITMVLAIAGAGCGGQSKSSSSKPAASGSSAGSQWTASNPYKVGFIYVGAPSDAGWTHAHEVGRLALEKAYGGRVKTVYKQNVPEGPQCEQVITQLVNEGAKMVIATSYGFQPSMVAAAKKYPNVLFEQATGDKLDKNLSQYFGAGEDGNYLSGMAAGFASKSGKIGYVAPFPIPEVIRLISAYTMGARYTHPGATVRVVWTNTWFDPAKERQAAQSLVSAGVDTLGSGQDSPTGGQVADAAGLKWTGYDSDQSQFAPKSWLTASTYNWGPYYIKTVGDAMAGTWKSHFYYGGLADGLVQMATFGTSLTADQVAKIKAREAEIKTGSFNPYAGPIKDQAGTVKIPAGKTMTVQEKYAMNWFAEGVIGSPKG